ncbi:MAG: amidohydrolase family protein [Candidatus Binataceae bacterium]|nr:amidohydrolase family protein [Candidatus Binataceae bacterium]
MKQLAGIIALADGSTRQGVVRFGDRIEAVDLASTASGLYILPGPIDLQVNGAGSLSVASGSADDLRAIARVLAHEGTTAFMPTAITAPLDRIEAIDRAIDQARADQFGDPAEAAILGMHLEGPFIARLGMHPRFNLTPIGEPFARVMRLRSLRLITLAPELAGAREAIARLTAHGVVVSLGHSDATFDQAMQAIAAGAPMCTHLFNAMRPLHHREPGIAAAFLSTGYAALIPDGVHVHPAMLRLAIKARGTANIIITTDKSPLDADIKARDGAARLADGTLAGSIISMLDGIRLIVEQAGVPLGEASRMASANPAAVLGLGDRGRIEPGARADLIVLDRELKLKTVFVGGRELN